jgi:hypothetical protein
MSQSESSGLNEYIVYYRYYPDRMEWFVEAVIPMPADSDWFFRDPNTNKISRRIPPQPSGTKSKLVEAKDELDAFQQVNQWLQKSNESLKNMGGLKL